MSSREIAGSSDLDSASRSASRCHNVEELEDELQTTKTMLDQLRVVMKKREEDTSRSKQEAEEIIKKLTKMKLSQKARVQSLKSRLHELEHVAGEPGEKPRSSLNQSMEEDETVATDFPDDESIMSDISVSELSDVSRLSASGAGLTRQLSDTREKCVEKLRKEKRKLEDLSKRMNETIRQKNQEFEALQNPTFSDPLPSSDKLAGSVRQIILLEKEINSLKAKIAEQENKIFALEENLREKEKIIEARTQAVALLSENLTKKNKEIATKLEDTRNEMVAMQENFVAKQDAWNIEREQILQDLDQQSERAAQYSYQVQSLEAVRFDMSLRNAELQEKVVRLQDDNEDRIRRVERDYQEDLEELEDSLNKARNQLKTQTKAKDKEISSLKAFVDSLKAQMQGTNDNSEDRCRKLEEENAVLVAKIATQREMIVAVEATDDAEEWKRRLLLANDDLDQHVKSLAELEREKLDLMQELAGRDKTINKLKRKLTKSTAKRKKVKEAEAPKDADVAEDSNAQTTDAEEAAASGDETTSAKEESADREKIIASLMEEVEELRTRVNDMEVINFGGMTDMVHEVTTKDAKIGTLESQLAEARSKIGGLEVEIVEKATLLEDLTQQLEANSATLNASEARVIKLTKDLENLQIQHADHEAELAKMADTLLLRNSDLDGARAELERVKEDLEAEVSAECRLRELEGALESVEAEKSAADDALARTRAELAARNTSFEELAAHHERQLEELVGRMTNDDDATKMKRAAELENEIESLRVQLEDARTEIEGKATELEELMEFATEKEQITAARVEELKAEVDKLEKAFAESNEELSRKDESISDLASLLEETRAIVIQREQQIRELEERVAKLEAARTNTKDASSGPNAEPSSVGEEEFLQSVVQASLDATENAALQENVEENSRQITALTSERNQLQEDVFTMAGDASMMLVDRSRAFDENNALEDELVAMRRKLEEAFEELSTLKKEKASLKEGPVASEQEKEALKCELEELTSRLDIALESLAAVRAELDAAHEEKTKILMERKEEADHAEKRIADLLADFEAHSKNEGVHLAHTMPQHVPDALQSRLDSIFRKFCIFVRSVAGACDNVCKEKGRGSQSGDDDNWGDWEESASDSEPYETPWWKQYVEEPEKFLHLHDFWEKLRLFADFVETVLYDELETLQMNRDELKQELELHMSDTPRTREDSELSGLRVERDSLVARLDAVTDGMMEYRDKCDEKEATVHQLMEEKQELEQKYERLMVKSQNKEAKVAADQQVLMRLGMNPVTVQDLQRTLHRLSCELFPRFVAGDEAESEAVLGGATSCPDFGAEGVEPASNLTIEDALKQALLELRARCFQTRSEDGEDGHVDVLDELRDRCVALREALDSTNAELDAKTKKLDELRVDNGRLAQSNREIRAAAQQISIHVGSIQDDFNALSRAASGELTACWDDFAELCSTVKARMVAAVDLAQARAEIEEQYKNEIHIIKEQLEDEKEENEHLNEKIASLEKCVFSEHLENQVSEQDNEIDRLRDQVGAVQQDLDSTREKLAEMEREKMALQDERNALVAQIRTSSTVDEPLVQSAENKDRELEALKTEFSALKTKYTKALARLKQLKTAGVTAPSSPAQAASSETKVDETSGKMETLLSDNTALKEELKKLSEELLGASSAAASGQVSSGEVDSVKSQLKATVEELESKSSEMNSLVAEKSSLEQQLEELQSSNAALSEKLRNMEEELESTRNAAVSFDDWGQDSSREVDSLKSQLKAAEEELRSKSSELENLVAESGSVEQQLQAARTQNDSLAAEMEDRGRRLDQLQTEFDAVSQEVASLREQSSRLVDMEREAQRLLEETNHLKTDLSRSAEVVEAKSAAVADLQNQLVASKHSRAYLVAELEEMKVRLQSAAENDDAAAQRLADFQAKHALLDTENKNLENLLVGSRQRVRFLEGENIKLEEELSLTQYNLKSWRDEEPAKETLIKDLTDDTIRLSEDLHHVKERLSELRGVLETKEEELDELGMQVETFKETAEEKSREVERLVGVELQQKTVIDSLSGALDLLAKENEAAQENIRSFEQRLSEAGAKHEEAVREAEQRIGSIKDELSEKQALVESLRDQLQGSEQTSEEVADLRRRVKEAETLLMMNEEERNEADALFAKVSEELNSSQAANAELTQKVASLENELTSSKSALEAALTDKTLLDQRVEEFVQQMEQQEEKFRVAEREKAGLEGEVEDLKDVQRRLQIDRKRQHAELSTRLSELEQGKEFELQSQRENFLSEIERLRESVTSVTQERDDLLADLREAKEKILVLEDAREEVLVTDEKLTLEAAIRDLESRLSGVTEERNSILAAKNTAEATIVSLTSQIDSLQASAADRAKEWETLTADLDERIAENLSAAHEIRGLQDELESLRQKQVAAPVVGNVELDEETKRLRAANEELQRANAELGEQCVGLASEVETLQGWLGRFKDSNVDHQSKEKDLATENQDLLRRLSELEDRQHDLSGWQLEKERLEASYEELKSAHDSAFSDYSDLQNRYEELRFEFDLAVSERDRMKAERVSDDEIKEMRLALVDKEVTISDLESRLETETEAQREEIEELKGEVEKMSQALMAHEQKWGSRDNESEDLVRSMEEVQAQLESHLVDLQEKDQMIASLENRIRELDVSKQEVVESLTKEKAVLESELANVKVHQEKLQQSPAAGDGKALKQLEEELEQQLRKGFSSKEAEFKYHKVCLELEESRKEVASLMKRASEAETALQAAFGNNSGDVQNAYRIIQAEAQLAAAVAERDQLREREREIQEQLSLLRRRNEFLLNEMSDQWDQTTEDERQKAAGIMPDEAVKMELDNTIAALHVRDVRCEELAFEVTSLTEERDSLQIQLSSALKRELELRRGLKKEMQSLTSTLTSGADVGSSSPETDLRVDFTDKEVTRRIEELQKLNYNLDVQLATEREARKKLAERLERRRRRLGKSAVPPRMSPPVTPDPSSVVEERDVTINSVVP